MTPSKVWDIRARDVPRDIWPDGRVRIRLGVKAEGHAKPRRRLLELLRGYGEWEIIRAVEAGQIDVSDIQRAFRTGSDEAAIARLRARIVDVGMASLPSVQEAIEEYLKTLRTAPPNTESQRTTSFRAALRVDPKMGELGIERLPASTLRKAIEKASESPNTREGIRTAFSALYSWAIERERDQARQERRAVRFDRNPAQEIDRWQGEPRPETASEAQVEALIGSANIYQEAYLRSLVQMGFRLGELTHTRLHLDLDVETWTWRIQGRGPSKVCGCPACKRNGWKTKTKRSKRELLVPEGVKLRSAILRHLEAYPAEEGDFVFRHPDGQAWVARTFRDDFRRLCERAEVKYGRDVEGGITPHTLRHTCATNLIRSGVDSSIVAAILGDAVETVVRVYVHMSPDDLATGVARGPSW